MKCETRESNSLLVSFIYSFLCIHVAWEIMANKKIISTSITGVPFQRLKKWVVVIASKCSASYIHLGLFKPRIWFKLCNQQGLVLDKRIRSQKHLYTNTFKERQQGDQIKLRNDVEHYILHPISQGSHSDFFF